MPRCQVYWSSSSCWCVFGLYLNIFLQNWFTVNVFHYFGMPLAYIPGLKLCFCIEQFWITFVCILPISLFFFSFFHPVFWKESSDLFCFIKLFSNVTFWVFLKFVQNELLHDHSCFSKAFCLCPFSICDSFSFLYMTSNHLGCTTTSLLFI